MVLDALVRGPAHRVCHVVGHHHSKKRCLIVSRLVTARIARITDVSISISNGTATGTVNLTASTSPTLV